MLLSVQWMISTFARESASTTSMDDARRVAHAGADDRELRAAFAHAHGQIQIAEQAANVVSAIALDEERDAGLIDRHMSIEILASATRRNISSSVSMRRVGDSMSPRMMRTHVTRPSSVTPVTGR